MHLLKNSYLDICLLKQYIPLCNYFHEDEIIQLRLDSPGHIKISSMDIHSSSKNVGCWYCWSHYRWTLILTEIGACNLERVLNLLDKITTARTMSNSGNIMNVQVFDNIVVIKTWLYPKCETEPMFLQFSYMNIDCFIGGIYWHPNGVVNHLYNHLNL